MAAVKLTGGFPPGTKVELFERTGDFYSGATAGKAVGSTTVSAKGEAQFTGLDDGDRFWAVGVVDGVVRSRIVTAKSPAKREGKLDRKQVAESLSQTRPPSDALGVLTGARGTGASDAADLRERAVDTANIPEMGKPTDKDQGPDETQLFYKQADVSGPQRSDTPLGEAHPVNPDEQQPKVSQDAVKKGTPQRSDTPLGEATPLEPGEVQPAMRQADAPDSMRQRSATPLGQVEPLRDPGYPKARQKESDEELARRVQVGEDRERPDSGSQAVAPRGKAKPVKTTAKAAAKPKVKGKQTDRQKAEAVVATDERQAEVDRQEAVVDAVAEEEEAPQRNAPAKRKTNRQTKGKGK